MAKLYEIYLVALLILASMLLRLPFISNELLPEEAINIQAGNAIAQSGFPIIYLQEIEPNFVHFQHPPMLFSVLAIFFSLLGESDVVARLAMLSFGVLYIFLTYLFCRYVFVGKDEYWVRFLAPGLLLVNPYSVQMSIDIAWEGGVLTFFTTLWMLVCYLYLVRTSSSPKLWSLLGMILAFYLLLWTKIESSLILLFFLSVFFLVHRDWKRVLILYAVAGSATVLFLLSLYAYSATFGYPEAFWIPFDFLPLERLLSLLRPLQNIASATEAPSTIYQPTRSLYALSFVLWITLAFATLVWSALIQDIFGLIRRQRKLATSGSPHLYLWLWAAGFIFVYIGYGWVGAYPRYFVPSLPPLAILAAVLINRNLLLQPRRLIFWLFITTATGLVYVALRLTDLLDRTLIYSNRNPTDSGFVTALLALFLIGILFAVFLRVHLRTFRQSLVLALLGFYLLSATHFWMHDLTSPNSVRSTFGQYGYREAGLYLKELIDPQKDILFTLDNIAYYAGALHFYNQWIVGPYPDVQDKLYQQLVEKQVEISYVALPTSWLEESQANGNDPLLNWLSARASDRRIFGTISVFAIDND